MILILLSVLLASTNAANVISLYGDVHKDVEFFTRTFPWIIDNIGGELIVEYNLLGSGRYSVPQMCALEDLKLNTFLQAQYLKCEAEGKPSGYCLCEAGIDPHKFKQCVASGGLLASLASAKYTELGINLTPVIELEQNNTVYETEDIWFLKKVCAIFGNNLPRGCINYSDSKGFPGKKAYAQFDRACDKEFPISDDVEKPATTTEWSTWGTTTTTETIRTTQSTPSQWWKGKEPNSDPNQNQGAEERALPKFTVPWPITTTECPTAPDWWFTTPPPWSTTPPPWSTTPPPWSTTSPPEWFTTTTPSPTTTPGCNTAPDWWSTTPPPWSTTPQPWFTTPPPSTQLPWSTTPPPWSTTPPPWWSTTSPPWSTTSTPTPTTPGCNTAPDWWSTTPPPWSTTPPPWSTTSTPTPTTTPGCNTAPDWWSTTSPPWSTTPPPWSTTPPPWSTTPPPWSTTPPPWSTTPPPWSTTPPPWSTTPQQWWFITPPPWWSTTPPPWWQAKSGSNQNKENDEKALPEYSVNENKGNGEDALPKLTAPWPITKPPWPITNPPWTGPPLPYSTTPTLPWPWLLKQNKGNDENKISEPVAPQAESEILAE